MPGPVPKHSSERRRRNKPDIERVSAAGLVGNAPPADPEWHPIATQLWSALQESGQSQFYEPSDWAFAYSLMDDLTYYKGSPKRSGQMLQSIYSAFERLLVTEGDRRRARVELERGGEEAPDPKRVAIMDHYRKAAQ